jgi:hypothetical protein
MAAPTINNNVSRTLNSNYTISTTKFQTVCYSISCTSTNPLLAGTSSATATLQYSTNGGSSWISIPQIGNSNSVTLTVTVQLNDGQTTQLTGSIPGNALVRIQTATSGSASIVYNTGQEIIWPF